MNYNNLTDKAAVTGLAFSWSEFRYDYINQDIWTRHVVNISFTVKARLTYQP